MITKTYPIITIDIIQIIDSTLNQNLSCSILKYTELDQIDQSELKWTKLDQIDRSEQNGLNIPNWTYVDRIDQSRLNWTIINRSGPNSTEVNEVN